MVLSYPPGAFSQSVRQRYRALASNQVLVIVEGDSDRRTLLPLLGDNVVLVPAGGRDALLDTYSRLEKAALDRCLYIVDCDNDFSNELKGRANLIITSHRDIEADALFDLEGYDRLAFEYLDYGSASAEELMARKDELLSFAAGISSRFGVVKDAARKRGLRLKLRDAFTNAKVRSTPADLPSIGSWVAAQKIPTLNEIAFELGRLMSWSNPDIIDVAQEAGARWNDPCRRHGLPGCGECRLRTSCNGHDLVATLAVDLSIRLTTQVTSAELDRHLRMSTNRDLVHRWTVGKRISGWENEIHLGVLRRRRSAP